MNKTLTLLRVYTTPKRLREIADNLERMMNSTRLGEDVPKIVEYGNDVNLEVHFTIDQDLWHRERRQR